MNEIPSHDISIAIRLDDKEFAFLEKMATTHNPRLSASRAFYVIAASALHDRMQSQLLVRVGDVDYSKGPVTFKK